MNPKNKPIILTESNLITNINNKPVKLNLISSPMYNALIVLLGLKELRQNKMQANIKLGSTQMRPPSKADSAV